MLAFSIVRVSPVARALTSGEGEDLLSEVLDGAFGDVTTGDLGDERGLPFQGLPHVDVEAGFSDVADDLDVGVLVALAEDASLALLDVPLAARGRRGGPGRRLGLDVGADAHGLGGADQDGDSAVSAGCEEVALWAWVLASCM